MKKITLLILIIGFVQLGWGQENEYQEILSRLKKIEEQNSDKVQIGKFKIKPYTIVFRGEIEADFKMAEEINEELQTQLASRFIRKGQIDSLKTKNYYVKSIQPIDSVVIAINEGVIEHIQVYTSDGKSFYNIKAPIPILTLENRFKDKLYNPQDNSYILLKDALHFEASRRFNYFPDSQEIVIKNKQNDKKEIIVGVEELRADNNINSMVNIQIYSDLLGVFSNEPNGLIQFEAQTKLFLHRANYDNKFIFKPFDAIEPFFHFNRIESKFDTIVAQSIQDVSRLEIFRRYTYAVGLDANLVRADWRPSNSFEFKAGYIYSSSNLVINNVKTSASIHTPYLEIALKNKKLNNFGFDMRVRYLWQRLNLNEVISDDEWNNLISFRASTFYFTSKNKTDKIFIRFINYLNLSDRREDFSLLQLGYSVSIF